MKKVIIGLVSLLLVGCSEFTAPNYSNNKDTIADPPISSSIPTNADKEIVGGVVVEVMDGNQFKVKIQEDALINGIGLSKGEVIIVRMLLSQAPSRIDQMPFGEEAYAFLYSLIMGKPVELEFEPEHMVDSMGNYLAYTYVEDNRIQDILIKNGFAKLASQDLTSTYENEFKKLEQLAISNEEGIWSLPNYVNMEEGFNAFILESSNISLQQIEDLEQKLLTKGNTLKENLFNLIETEIPEN
ncbi:MAG: thermonuclease family protein [Psychrobacillus sp.]